MAHKHEFVATGNGYWVKKADGTMVQPIDANGNVSGGGGGVPSGTEVIATNDTNVGASLDYFHDSASPAEGDALGQNSFYGNDAGANKTAYATMAAVCIDPTDGSEKGGFVISTIDSGTLTPGYNSDFLVEGGTARHTYNYDGTDGQELVLYHNSASPATDDEIGILIFSGNDSDGDEDDYSSISGVIGDPTAGATAGGIKFKSANGTGSLATCAGFYHNGSYGVVEVGDGSDAGMFSSSGDQDLVLITGNSTSSTIRITDGAAGRIQFAPEGAGVTQVYSSEAGASGAVLQLFQDSASPAQFDAVATFQGMGKDSAANEEVYANIAVGIGSPTDGSEEGMIAFNVVTGGSMTTGGDAPVIITGDFLEIATPIVEKQTEQALTGAGAIDASSQTTAWSTTAADAGTLDDGEDGQTKRVYCASHGGDGTLTPTNLLGYSNIVFTATGDCVELYFNGSSWVIASNQGCTLS